MANWLKILDFKLHKTSVVLWFPTSEIPVGYNVVGQIGMVEKTFTINTPEGDISLSTGKIAMLAPGAVMVQQGGTVLFAAVTVDNSQSEQDFFPLTIEYVEKMYSRGTISGSKVNNKREGQANDAAILVAREVDHVIRPLFPDEFKQPTNVIITLLADDGINDPHHLTVLAASMAIKLSGVPFHGPAAHVSIGVKLDGSLEVNPHVTDESQWLGVFTVGGVKNKTLGIEGWGKEVSEETMDAVLDLGMERVNALVEGQNQFFAKYPVEGKAYNTRPLDQSLVDALMGKRAELESGLYIADKTERDEALGKVTEALKEEFAGGEEPKYTSAQFEDAYEYVVNEIVHINILESDKRMSGRKLDEIRELKAEVNILPTVHGSALFNRGMTQALSIVTLGSTKKAETLNELAGNTYNKYYMHHYNMPGYATGEAKKFMARPGRREIGHGNIGENALRHMVPSAEEFPYTIRVVSEIMTSNGSTSMAATCGSSLALMAAGVPLKKHVGGIGVGLMIDSKNESNYKLVLDIEGMEDHYGDMDFKVTGTSDGITAIQFETKLKGVNPEILKKAFRLSKQGRAQVLEVMKAAISAPAAELAPTAPRVETVTIPQDMIGELIGPGGKNIRGLIESTQFEIPGDLDIDIDDSGRVVVTAANKAQLDSAVAKIKSSVAAPEIGAIYEGIVDKVMPYGAFVDVSANISGLVHVSEMADKFVSDPNEIVKEGQTVKVKLIKIENGKLSFSMKQAA